MAKRDQSKSNPAQSLKKANSAASDSADASSRSLNDKLNLAAHVAQLVQIEDVLMLSMSARHELRQGTLPKEIGIDVKVEAEFDSAKTNIILNIKCAAFSTGKNSKSIQFEGHYLLRYEVKSAEPLSQVDLQAFGEMNGVFNLWPFWREYVQSASLRMGLPPLTLPVYRPTIFTDKGHFSAILKRESLSAPPP